MIYATTKPIGKYNVTMPSGNVHGLENSYGHKPKLLAFILIALPVGYEYEGNKPPAARTVSVTHADVLEACLDFKLGVTTLGDKLSSSTPMEFYEWIKDLDLSELPVIKSLYRNNQETLKLVIGARAVAWKLNYKGVLGRKGNVIKVSFGGKVGGIPPVLLQAHKKMMEDFSG